MYFSKYVLRTQLSVALFYTQGESVQRNRNLHHKVTGRSVTITGRPYCDDTNDVVLAVQEAVRREDQHLGGKTQHDSGKLNMTHVNLA